MCNCMADWIPYQLNLPTKVSIKHRKIVPQRPHKVLPIILACLLFSQTCLLIKVESVSQWYTKQKVAKGKFQKFSVGYYGTLSWAIELW